MGFPQFADEWWAKFAQIARTTYRSASPPQLAESRAPCDSPAVPVGRGRKLVLALAFLACALSAASIANAVTPVDGGKKKFKFVFMKARVSTDGFVTPGQLETIAVSHLPSRAQLRVFIDPPPTTPQCGELYFCDPAPTAPAEGAPPYRSTGKGEALLTFVVPTGYFVETDPFHPGNGFQATFAHGQSVHIDVGARKTHKRVRVEAFGFARAIVALPPPS